MKVAVFVLWLVVDVQGQDQASARRSMDYHGGCQYTFTVDSPVESSCSSNIEAENLSARITLLEAVVSCVLGAEAVTETVRKPAEMEEMQQLLQDKGQLDKQVKELQRRVEELTMEAEKLRQKPCPLVHDSEDSFGINRGSGED